MMKNVIVLAACGVLLFAGSALAADKAGDAAKGKEVFEQCSVCHEVATDEKKMGPSLKGLYKKGKLKNGKAVTDANVLAVVNAGGNGMPAYQDMLTDAEKADLIAYLKGI
jgi:cytochrome c2